MSQCVLINAQSPINYLKWAWAMEDIDFYFKTNDLLKINPEDGLIVMFNDSW